ncbi:Putative DNA-binding domain-containing protein [Sphingobacterium nematocida]|uniref:Putative DNA-binding domain-containing protein n=1 Tax=Sphingobacterium nematocida TaxID=1513896 RepID=A0A1T5B0I2_9SPHI|nr:ATP-binding protein [Sphingobacterium nematocida]SKB40726.1 Putative DNA-binding domain-containing protein [Sphingobacterium nematocida]
MNSQDFRTQILMKKPRYAKSRIPLIDILANKGQSKSEYAQFGPIYELFIYSFVLGLKRKSFLPLPGNNLTKDFVEIAKWKGGSSLVDFLLMTVLIHTDELGFTWNELEDMQEKDLDKAVSQIISFLEGYANGGLEYLQELYNTNQLINSPYLFVDLLAENSTLKEVLDEDNISLESQEATEDTIVNTKKLIEGGESPNVEFKSTLRVNMHTIQADDKMELSCIKTIAGYMNTKPGTLLIGVSDQKEILGLEKDLASFGNKPDPMDEFQKHLDNLIESYLGNSAYSLITLTFPEIDAKKICRLDVQFSKKGPVYAKNKSKKIEEFYIRRAASTVALNASEMIGYIENHWG